MKLKRIIYFTALILLLLGCKKEYEYNKVCIDDTKFVHWGRGFYRLKIFYIYKYNNELYRGYVLDKAGLYYSSSRKHYNIGDTIIIKYPKEKPNKSEIVKLVYRKNGNLLGNGW